MRTSASQHIQVIPRRLTPWLWLFFITSLLAIVLSVPVWAADAPSEAAANDDGRLATVVVAIGDVFRLPAGTQEWQPLGKDEPLFMRDRIRTGDGGKAVLLFRDQSQVKLNANTTLELFERENVEKPVGVVAKVRMFIGSIFARVSPQKSSLEFETPDAVATIRGTEFGTDTAPTGGPLPSPADLAQPMENYRQTFPSRTVWGLLEGALNIASFVDGNRVDVDLETMEETTTQSNEAPSPPAPLPDEDANRLRQFDNELPTPDAGTGTTEGDNAQQDDSENGDDTGDNTDTGGQQDQNQGDQSPEGDNPPADQPPADQTPGVGEGSLDNGNPPPPVLPTGTPDVTPPLPPVRVPVVERPVITSVTPREVTNDTTYKLAIQGTGFTQVQQVLLDEVSLAITARSSGTSMEVQLPGGFPAGSYDLTAVSPVGTSNAVSVEVMEARPVLQTISPAHAFAGQGVTVTLTGEGFANAEAVSLGTYRFEGDEIEIVDNDTIRVQLPADMSPGSYAVTVIARSGNSLENVVFTVDGGVRGQAVWTVGDSLRPITGEARLYDVTSVLAGTGETAQPIRRVTLNGAGGFQLQNVRTGHYVVEVINTAAGFGQVAKYQRFVSVSSAGADLNLGTMDLSYGAEFQLMRGESTDTLITEGPYEVDLGQDWAQLSWQLPGWAQGEDFDSHLSYRYFGVEGRIDWVASSWDGSRELLTIYPFFDDYYDGNQGDFIPTVSEYGAFGTYETDVVLESGTERYFVSGPTLRLTDGGSQWSQMWLPRDLENLSSSSVEVKDEYVHLQQSAAADGGAIYRFPVTTTGQGVVFELGANVFSAFSRDTEDAALGIDIDTGTARAELLFKQDGVYDTAGQLLSHYGWEGGLEAGDGIYRVAVSDSGSITIFHAVVNGDNLVPDLYDISGQMASQPTTGNARVLVTFANGVTTTEADAVLRYAALGVLHSSNDELISLHRVYSRRIPRAPASPVLLQPEPTEPGRFAANWSLATENSAYQYYLDFTGDYEIELKPVSRSGLLTTKTGNASFRDLPAGPFRFGVRVLNEQGRLSQAAWPFEVEPYWTEVAHGDDLTSDNGWVETSADASAIVERYEGVLHVQSSGTLTWEKIFDVPISAGATLDVTLALTNGPFDLVLSDGESQVHLVWKTTSDGYEISAVNDRTGIVESVTGPIPGQLSTPQTFRMRLFSDPYQPWADIVVPGGGTYSSSLLSRSEVAGVTFGTLASDTMGLGTVLVPTEFRISDLAISLAGSFYDSELPPPLPESPVNPAVILDQLSPVHVAMSDSDPTLTLTGTGLADATGVRLVSTINKSEIQVWSDEAAAASGGVISQSETLLVDLSAKLANGTLGPGMYQVAVDTGNGRALWTTGNQVLITTDRSSSEGTMARYDFGRTGVFNGGPPDPTALAERWKNVDVASSYEEPFYQESHQRLVAIDQYHVVGLNSTDGSASYVALDNPYIQAILGDNQGRVFVGYNYDDGHVKAVGTTTWDRTLTSGPENYTPVNSLVSVVEGVLVVMAGGYGQGLVMGIDAASGVLLWQTSIPYGWVEPPVAVRNGSSLNQPSAYILEMPNDSPATALIAVDLVFGRVQWSWWSGQDQYYQPPMVEPTGAELVLLGSSEVHNKISLQVLDPSTGATKASKEFGIPVEGYTPSTVLMDGKAYILSSQWIFDESTQSAIYNPVLHQVDLRTLEVTPINVGLCESIDCSDLYGGPVLTGARLSANAQYLYAASGSYLWVVSLPDGKLVKRKKLQGLPTSARVLHIVPGGDALYLVLDDYDSSTSGPYVMSLTTAADGSLVDPNLTKRVNKGEAKIGDVLTYTVQLDNTVPVGVNPVQNQANVRIEDNLPLPLRYRAGSTLVDPDGPTGPQPWQPAADPTVTNGTLVWNLTSAANGGQVNAFTQRSISYQAVVSAAAVEGATYTNTARGFADMNGNVRLDSADQVLTPVASADVTVAQSVFSAEGTIVGRVFVDQNQNGTVDPGEKGLADVELTLENGVTVRTDLQGRFSVSGLAGGLHVMRIDMNTVPDAYVWSSSPSVWVDLRDGGIRLVRFALDER